MIRRLKRWWQRKKFEATQEWGHVPPPEWAAKRGSGRDYW